LLGLVVSPIAVSAIFCTSLPWLSVCATAADQGVASTRHIFPEAAEGKGIAPAAKVAKALRGAEKGRRTFFATAPSLCLWHAASRGGEIATACRNGAAVSPFERCGCLELVQGPAEPLHCFFPDWITAGSYSGLDGVTLIERLICLAASLALPPGWSLASRISSVLRRSVGGGGRPAAGPLCRGFYASRSNCQRPLIGSPMPKRPQARASGSPSGLVGAFPTLCPGIAGAFNSASCALPSKEVPLEVLYSPATCCWQNMK